MKLKKRGYIICGSIIFIFLMTAVSFASIPIKLFVNGNEQKTTSQPKLIDGAIFISLRTVAQALGVKADFNKKTNSINITKGKTESGVTQERAKNYPQVPKKIASPKMLLEAYFDALNLAANLTPAEMGAAGGTVAMDKEPYPTAYGYWSKEWQAKNSKEQFLASWQGTANVELERLVDAGIKKGKYTFFVETKNLEVVGKNPRIGIFYYTSFFTVQNTKEGWKILSGQLKPENPAWEMGGHQPWRGDPKEVALVELGYGINDTLGKATTVKNLDGTVTIKSVDKGKTSEVTLVQLEDKTWQVITKK